MTSRISCGCISSSLFTLPSGPGDMSLLKVLMHSVKALLSRILGWSHFLCLSPWESSFVICDWRVKGSRQKFPGTVEVRLKRLKCGWKHSYRTATVSGWFQTHGWNKQFQLVPTALQPQSGRCWWRHADLLPEILSGCIFRQVFALFHVNSFHDVWEVFFLQSEPSSGLGLNGVSFWVTQSLEACSRLCIIVFKDFLTC